MEPLCEQSKQGGVGTTGTANSQSKGIPRAQSSLELLSQTAAVLELSPNPSGSNNNSFSLNNNKLASFNNLVIPSAVSSPKEAARGVTPTDSFMAQQRVPSIPEMSKKMHQPVYLEQKRSNSFLPAPLLGENSESTNGEGRDGMPPFYSPGLFLSYSNGSTGGSGNTNTGQLSNDNHQGSNTTTHPPVPSATSSGSSEGEGVVSNFLTSHGSFASSGSLASAPAFHLAAPAGNLSSMAPAAAFVPPSSSQLLKHANSSTDGDGSVANRENYLLRQQLASKDATIESLRKQVEMLQREVQELRQLPTGKISQIPVEDMLALMREYGSEVSDTCMPPRKQTVQKASVVRQFRRWNPNFLEFFEIRNGQWVPKLGKEAELARRQAARRQAAMERKKKLQEKTEVAAPKNRV